LAAPGVVAPIDLLALTDALDELEQLDARQAQIIELRFFGGLDTSDTARILGVSTRTIEGEWALARAWLRQRMSSGEHAKR
jgi:RNA polymerase sigma-70 factor, ECF subfamily